MRVKASTIINIMNSWVGMDRADGSHAPIIDLYNSHVPVARGYKVTYKDSYCDTTVSAAFIKANAVDMIGGTECGCEEHIKIFKKEGIWEEDGTIMPEPGYIILYNWDERMQPNNGYADHIGIVEKVDGVMITVIEGNIKGKVGKRTIEVGNGYIRGYAIPDYLPEDTYPIGWNSNSFGKWYQYGPGKENYYKDSLKQIDGKIYAFDPSGYMKEGYFIVKANDDGEVELY